MRIAAVVVACVLGSAAVAWAADAARAAVGPVVQAPEAAKPPAPAAQPARPASQPAQLMAPAQAAPPAAAGAPPAATKRSEDARAHPDVARRPEPPRRVCFGPAETREKIAAHRLAEPIKALRVGRQQGEALRARLCSLKTDKFFYEVFVLRRDGRIVHVFMNATNGQAVGALSEPDLK